MAATDERPIHEFPTGTIDDNSLLIMDRPTSTPGEYETEKFAIANLALKILGGIDFPNDLDTEEQDIFGAINEVNAKAMNIAAEYDETASYSKGDYCIYQNASYRCIKASGTTTGTFVAADWTQIKVLAEVKANTEEISLKQDKLSNSDIPITVLSQSVGDVTLKCTRYGNVACITGYFRTTASISANSSIFSGFPNPVVPSGDTNLYFLFLNETDGTLMRFRINRNYCELKNPVALASGKTFVGSACYICD